MNAQNLSLAGSRKNETKPVPTRQAPGTYDIPIVTVMMAAMLFYAWERSGEGHLTAETGIGYYLGIVGSLMMLLLLVYPLRKRLRSLRWVGNVPGWFRLHMIFGVVGPSLVLLHSNFVLGSLNSRVALFSMLLVAGSGYIGRFLYQRIHRGLNGRRRSAADLRDEAAAIWSSTGEKSSDTAIEDQLIAYEHRFLRQEKSLLVAMFRLVAARKARRAIRKNILANNRDVALKGRLNAYLDAIRSAQTFFVYERLFSLWHLLHLPVFLLLVAAALLHIFAVHLY